MADIRMAARKARQYFERGETLDAAHREESLLRIERYMKRHEQEIETALKSDLNKCRFEAQMTEIGLVYHEIDYMVKHIRRWSRPIRRRASLGQFPGHARVCPQPYGVVLIMSPWNYPFQLTMMPLVGALAAGNCAVVKPSKDAPATSRFLLEMADVCFGSGEVQVIEGGRFENEQLLEEEYDYIFFTGSAHVGRVVMEKAARHLTPVTLELGGKSPVIVDKSADLALAARRILFGKLLNAGQTCVAPDYVLAERSVKEELCRLIVEEAKAMLPDEDYVHANFGRIVNEKHFERLKGLLNGQTLLTGGQSYAEHRQIAFTLVDEPAMDSPLMQDEIFGPILPILAFDTIAEAAARVRALPQPLAFYLFTRDRDVESFFIENLPFGGGCVNDTVLHLASHHIPFGGVGPSGMGLYHGKYSFDTFSHMKSVLVKHGTMDFPLRYHPYKNPEGKLPGVL